MKHHILLVEDDQWLAQLYQDALTADASCAVLHAASAEAALDLLDKHSKIDLIILDMFLPGHNGIEFLHELASYSDINELPVIVLTSVTKNDFSMSQDRWQQYGVVQYLYKPETKPSDLLAAIKKQYARL